MAEINYCERCGNRVSPSELDSGKALMTPAGAVCGRCAKSLGADELARLTGPPSPKPGPAGPRSVPSPPTAPRPGRSGATGRQQAGRQAARQAARQGAGTTSARRAGPAAAPPPPPGAAPEKKPVTGLALAGVGAGVLVGVAVALVMMSGRDGPAPAAPRPPTARGTPSRRPPAGPPRIAPPAALTPRTRPASPPSAARDRLQEIRRWRGPSLGRYAGMRRALEAFPADHPGAPEIDEAKKLLAEIDREYAALAFAAYRDACETAYALVARGKHDEAAAALRAVGERFGEGPWGRETGATRIREMLAKIESTRGEAARKGLARAREAFDTKAYAAAREALSTSAGRAGWPAADRAKADALLEKIDGIEAAAKAEQEKAATWRAFLARLREAGGKGVPEARSLLARERKDLASAGLGREAALVERRVRNAARVEELAAIGLSMSRRSVRLTWKGTPVAGRIIGVEGGVIKLKTSLRKEHAIPVSELAPRDVAGAVGKSMKAVDLAGYYMVRGDLEGARKLLAEAAGKEATALRDEIESMEEAAKASPVPPPAAIAAATGAEKPGTEKPGAEKPGAKEPGVKPAATPAASPYRPGLCAEYFEGVDLEPAKLKATRVDPKVEFNWDQDAPLPGMGADNFSCRWTGEIKVPADGEYEFKLERDDRARLWIAGSLVIDWDNGNTPHKAKLSAGWVPVGVEFKEHGGSAHVTLRWSGPGLGERTVGAERFRTTGRPVSVAEMQPLSLPEGPKQPLPGETGKPGQWAPGLISEIFKGTGFRDRVGVRIDRNIDYEYGKAGPDLGMPGTDFSVRWTGWLLIPCTGDYVFDARGDDSLDVKLDGKPLVRDEWDKTGATPPLVCEAGLHPVTAELVQGRDWSRAELKWKRPGRNDTVPIPAEYFFHEVPKPGSMGPFAKLCHGIVAEYYMGEAFERKIGEAVLDRFEFDAGQLPLFIRQNVPLKDRLSIRMTGFIQVENDRTCKFEVEADDGARVFFDGQKIGERWNDKHGDKITGEKRAAPGFHKIVVEFLEKNANARLVVRYERWGMSEVRPNILFREATAGAGAAKALIVDRRGLAPGLTGRLYASEKPGLTQPALTTFDPSVRFEWWKDSPGPGLPRDRFSGTWTGVLLVPQGGQHLFRVWHQGGIKLAVGGKVIINRWSPVDGWQEGSLGLRAGPVRFDLNYFERRKDRDSVVRAYWCGPGIGYRRLGPAFLAHSAREVAFAKAWEKKEPPKVAAAGGAAGGAAGRGGASKTGAAPKPPPLPPSLGGEKPPEPMPEGNLVVNGGFEKLGDDNFASGWRRWMKGGKQASVRTDRAEAHSGGSSLSAKAFADGVQAGAWCTIPRAMPPGKYEARFWACSEVGKTRIQVVIAVPKREEEIATATVGEDWTQVKQQFEVSEKKVRPSLRIFVTTPRVKVWLDDVEVEAVK